MEISSDIKAPLHHEFLPLYPNSHWIYENELGQQDTFFTTDYDTVSLSCVIPPVDVSDSIITTTLHREPILPDMVNINGYKVYPCLNTPHNNTFMIVLSEYVGTGWPVRFVDSRYNMTNQFKRTETVEENYLEVIEYEGAIQMGAVVNDTIIYRETYELGIGLTERLRINVYTNDTTAELKLIDYHINR